MDIRNADLIPAALEKRKAQLQNLRLEVQSVLKNPDKQAQEADSYSVFFPKEIEKSVTKAEKKAIKMIAFSNFKVSLKVVDEMLLVLEAKNIFAKFKPFNLIKQKVIQSDKQNITELIKGDLIKHWGEWTDFVKQIPSKGLTQDEVTLCQELYIWLEGIYLNYCIAFRRNEINTKLAKSNQKVAHIIKENKTQITKGEKEAIIQIGKEIKDNESILIVSAILNNVLDCSISDEHTSRNLMSILMDLDIWDYILNLSKLKQSTAVLKIKNDVIPMFDNMQRGAANLGLHQDNLDLLKELTPWFVGLYYDAYKDKDDYVNVKNSFTSSTLGISRVELSARYLKMAENLNQRIEQFIAAEKLKEKEKIKEKDKIKEVVAESIPMSASSSISASIPSDTAVGIPVVAEKSQEPIMLEITASSSSTSTMLTMLTSAPVQPTLNQVTTSHLPQALMQSNSSIDSEKYVEPKNWKHIKSAQGSNDEIKIQTLNNIVSNDNLALTNNQKEALAFLKSDLKAEMESYKSNTWVKHILPTSLSQWICPRSNSGLATTVTDTLDGGDITLTLKQIFAIRQQLTINGSTHLLPALNTKLVNVWTHLYNVGMVEQEENEKSVRAQYALFQSGTPKLGNELTQYSPKGPFQSPSQ